MGWRLQDARLCRPGPRHVLSLKSHRYSESARCKTLTYQTAASVNLTWVHRRMADGLYSCRFGASWLLDSRLDVSWSSRRTIKVKRFPLSSGRAFGTAMASTPDGIPSNPIPLRSRSVWGRKVCESQPRFTRPIMRKRTEPIIALSDLLPRNWCLHLGNCRGRGVLY